MGSRWIKNKTIVGLVGDLSGKRSGNRMRANFDYDKVAPLVRYLRLNMPLYVINSKADVARTVAPARPQAKLAAGPARMDGRSAIGTKVAMTEPELRAALAPI